MDNMYYNNPWLYAQSNPYGAISQPQPYTMAQVQNPQPQNPVVNDNKFIWVQGKEGAKAYPTAPGVTLLFLDDQEPYVYKKVTDKEGKTAEFKTYKLVEEVDGEVDEGAMAVTKRDLWQALDDLRTEIEPRLFNPKYKKRENTNGKPTHE